VARLPFAAVVTNGVSLTVITASSTVPAFGSQAFGYAQRATQTIRITNTGTGFVTLNNLPSMPNWTLVQAANWRTQIAAGQSRTFTIRPDNFLIAGTYNPVITITGNDGASTQVRPTFTVTAQPPIESFVIRLYQNVLGRNHDASGLKNWAAVLRKGVAGADVAYGFFFSPEFQKQKTSDATFVDILYRTLLNRNPDASGRANWLALLQTGFPREDIFSGFVNSTEFTKLCSNYGIIRGNYTAPPGGMARVFATRLYRTVLQREPDIAGLNNWQNALVSGSATGASVAYGFLFSPEMIKRNLDDDRYVEVLYNSMLGRSSDAAGKADWLKQLRNGASRYSVFTGFVYSKEFDRICRDHGIIRGTVP